MRLAFIFYHNVLKYLRNWSSSCGATVRRSE
jgi:hypothetical protein